MRLRRALGWAASIAVLLALVAVTGCDDGGPGGGEDTLDTMVADAGDTAGEDTADDIGDTAVPDASDDATDGTDATDATDGGDATDVDDTCDPACGDNEMCADPATDTCECVDGFDDCDGDASNGCEANLRDTAPETCGSCDVGEFCNLFGVEPVCDHETQSCDPAVCATRHYDLDGDAADVTPVNGCETGFERFGTGGTMLTGVGTDGLSQLVWDETAQVLFGLELAATVKVHAIEIDAMGVPSVSDSVDTMLAPSGASSMGAHDGFVAVTRTIGVNFYEWDGSGLVTIRELNATDTLSVTEVGPVLTDTRAEFVASTASGLTWYAIYDQGSEPAGMTCLTGDAPSTTSVCEVATSTLNTNVTLMDYGSIGGADYLLTVGDNTTEFILQPDPTFDPEIPAGPSVSASVPATRLLSADQLSYVDGSELVVLDYALDAQMSLDTRTEAHRVTLQSAANDLVELDADRVAVATEGGIELVLLADTPGTAMLDGISVAATALARDDTRMFVATGDRMSVFELDLGPLE